MMTKCPACGGRVLTTSMTAEEESRYAAAFRCIECQKRFVERWPRDREGHVAVDEK